ncbi:MAG: hypothetical protein Q9163_001765 [Psora crenata]
MISTQAIRRSIKGEKDTKPPLHNSIPAKSAVAIQPPKKVIKAKYDYSPNPGNQQELGFAKGDFFHVISRENDGDWYEACNPLISSARGLVPVSFFEVVGKQDRQSAGSIQSGANNVINPQHDSGYSEKSGVNQQQDQKSVGKNQGHSRATSMTKGSGAMVYGVVMYDFKAERPDELEAEKGESIIIIAQSNPEWFVAKPIKRLGGPGLIPVSFIEIRDMNTGQPVADTQGAVARAGVPKVEEWKRLATNYKNSSIPLGKFSDGVIGSMSKDMERMSLSNGGPHVPAVNGNYHLRQSSRSMQNGHNRQSHRHLLAPVSASIPRYIFESDKYWYIIECQMEDGRWWELSRSYQKFYDFQIALLQQFPKEAQTPPGGKRLLPFMPGPVTYVTDAISNGRRESLNTYVHELLALPPYISRCDLVRELFAPGDGDYELDPDRVTENFRHSDGSHSSANGDVSRTVSRRSSDGPMNGANGYANMGPPPSKTLPQQRHQANGAPPNQQQQYRTQSDHPYHNQIKPQSSNITQASSTSSFPENSSTTNLSGNTANTSVTSTSNSSGAVKIKVNFQDETIVIRVPTDISFQQLRDKCKERLKITQQEEIMVSYRDEPTGQVCEMLSDRDLDMALSRCQRLALFVNFV